MDQKQLKQLLKVLRENGVLHYKTVDIELNLSSEFLLKPKTELQVEEQDPNQPVFPNMSQEDLMFYSAGGAPVPEEN